VTHNCSHICSALERKEFATFLRLLDESFSYTDQIHFSELSSAIILAKFPHLISLIALYPNIAIKLRDNCKEGKLAPTKISDNHSLMLLSILYIILNDEQIELPCLMPYEPNFVNTRISKYTIFWQNFLAYLPVADRLRILANEYYTVMSRIPHLILSSDPANRPFFRYFFKEAKDNAPEYYSKMFPNGLKTFLKHHKELLSR